MSGTISLEKIIEVIEASELDPTIKEILVRDLKSEGLTEFLEEQIKAYCDKAIAILEKRKGE